MGRLFLEHVRRVFATLDQVRDSVKFAPTVPAEVLQAGGNAMSTTKKLRGGPRLKTENVKLASTTTPRCTRTGDARPEY